MIISARAIGVYAYMIGEGRVMPARQLMDVLDEGRNAIQKAINELRDANIIRTKRTRLSNGFVSYSGFVEPQYWDPKIGTLSLLLKLYSQYSQYTNMANKLNDNSYLYLPNSREGSREEKNILYIGGKNVVYYEPSADDLEYESQRAEERIKASRQKKEDYQQEMLKAHDEKIAIRHRDRVDPRDWTASDSAYEFANRLHFRWDVAPFAVKQTRFIPALFNARAKYNTNGLIEKKMIEMFLVDSLVKTMHDPEQIWKLFISRFSQLAEEARYVVEDPDKLERARQATERSRRRMMEDDD